MVAISSTSSRSVGWNVGALAEVPDGSPSPGSMVSASPISPVLLLAKFLLCSSGVLISISPLIYPLVDRSMVSNLSPVYTEHLSFRSRQGLRITQFHHNLSEALFER